MASPFAVFRKHQKILIATLGLLAMIAFVFLPMILKNMDSRAAKNPVVVETTKYGDLHENDLQQMRHRRQRLLNFLQGAVMLADEEDMVKRMKAQGLARMLGDTSEEATVDHWLFVRHAQELGMTIDDRTINEFINSVTNNRVTTEQFAGLFKRLQMSEEELFDTLHDELLVQNLRVMFDLSARATTPAQRWDYYQRLNRRVSVEVAPVAVAPLAAEIADPSEEELKAFFEKHKNDYAHPESPEPGFRVPRKVAIEYLKADYETFADPDAVTDEEIEAYYKENRDRLYQNFELPGLDTTPSTPEPSADAEKKAEPVEKKAEPVEKKAEPVEKKAEPVEKKAEPVEEKAEPVEKKAEPVEKKAEPVEKKAEPVEKKSPDEKKGSDEEAKKTSSVKSASLFRLVSTGEQEKAKKEEPQSEEKPKLELPAATLPLPGAEAKQPAESDAGKEAEPPKKDAAPKKPAEPKPKYKPLAEVKDEIRRILADKKADQRVLDVLGPIESKMKAHHSALILHETKEDAENGSPPQLDLEALAKKSNLTFHRTELIPELDTYQLDIGKSAVDGQQSFVRVIFEGLTEHRPGISQDIERDYYLFWKTDSADERVPEFEDEGIRDQVLASWKMVQARKLAKDKAEKLADEARKSGKSLGASIGKLPDVEVSKAGPFSWMTTGSVPASMYRNQPRLSQVEHVELAGEDFMRAVYDLKVDEIGVAMNQPKTIAYVVRLTETTPNESVLWSMFKADDYSKYFSLAMADTQKMNEQWREELQKAAGLKWVRQANRRRAGQ